MVLEPVTAAVLHSLCISLSIVPSVRSIFAQTSSGMRKVYIWLTDHGRPSSMSLYATNHNTGRSYGVKTAVKTQTHTKEFDGDRCFPLTEALTRDLSLQTMARPNICTCIIHPSRRQAQTGPNSERHAQTAQDGREDSAWSVCGGTPPPEPQSPVFLEMMPSPRQATNSNTRRPENKTCCSQTTEHGLGAAGREKVGDLGVWRLGLHMTCQVKGEA